MGNNSKSMETTYIFPISNATFVCPLDFYNFLCCGEKKEGRKKGQSILLHPLFGHNPASAKNKHVDKQLLQFHIPSVATKKTHQGSCSFNFLHILLILFLFQFFQLKPVCLIMWGRFVSDECKKFSEIIRTKPIIIGTRIRVSSYNDIFNH